VKKAPHRDTILRLSLATLGWVRDYRSHVDGRFRMEAVVVDVEKLVYAVSLDCLVNVDQRRER
jgi:hypothetical protein